MRIIATLALTAMALLATNARAQNPPDIAHGRYVAILADCTGCHTVPGGSNLAGGLALPTPLGLVYASNITPDAETGIGAYALGDFVRLMRQGVTPAGRHITPAMPYTAYAKMTDADLADLFAYLRQEVPPVKQGNHANGWLLSMSWPVGLWDRWFHDARPFQPDPAKDAVWNRGAYLVEGPAHCGTCHTPRGWAYQERALDRTSPLYLSGSVMEGGAPINLRGNDGDGLARWSEADIAELLKSGRTRHAAATGGMGEVVGFSTQYFNDDDLAAIATYLKSLAPAPEEGRAHYNPSTATLEAYRAGTEASPGGRIFMDSCSACHHLDGGGGGPGLPSLAGNASVLTRDPASLLAVILKGARLPSTEAAPSPLAMPGFAWRYDDGEIAALASFIRHSWGNDAGAVDRSQVKRVRKELGLN